MIVDRCVCCRITFKHLLESSAKNGWRANDACEATGCGSRCGMCLPYIFKAFQTKNPRVPLMSDAEVARILEAAQVNSTTATH